MKNERKHKKTTANKKSLRHLIYILCINIFVIIINMSKETNPCFENVAKKLRRPGHNLVIY